MRRRSHPIPALSFPRQGIGPRWSGPLLVVAGLLLIGGWTATLAAGEWRQAVAEAGWEQLLGGGGDAGSAQVPPPANLARPAGGVDFRLRVPRLGYRGVVHEGVSDEVLVGGPGHYPETAWPGQPGLVGVAAHNVYWLGFDRLRRGDDLVVDTRYGTFHYRVTSTSVVRADDRTVLASAPGRRLALTTCWPLWAGELATMRLAVFAA
jgi:sortase A